jgi:hypothetical protein
VQDVLAILSKEEDLPEKYILSSFVKPVRYSVELVPIPEMENGDVKLRGHVTIDFQQNGINGPNQLVLNSKHLALKSCRLLIHDNAKNSTSDKPSGSRRKRDTEEVKNGAEIMNFNDRFQLTKLSTIPR